MKNDNDRLRDAFVKSKEYKPYISSIVFAQYKNLTQGAEITFEFPLTLLIGKNGTNKSSILHALYGSPEGKSPGEYWFATHIDPINVRSAFFYRYIIPETGDEAEVLKTLIQKRAPARKNSLVQKKQSLLARTDPDYWEPSRPVASYGMKPMPPFVGGKSTGRSKTRWEAIRKDVLYLDFRAEISAFDKAFYKVDKSQPRSAHRRKLRTQSKALKEAIDQKLASKKTYGAERVYVNYEFNNAEIASVGNILDCSYVEIRYIEHNFFLTGSYSVYLKKADENAYSEAFAGSGEASIVRLVYALERAPNKALVLLDEPETSLHIQAQHKLREFLLAKIKQKYLQVVISTHSPYFAKNLPDCAIKVLQVDPNSQKVFISNSAPADDSSFYLGHERGVKDKVLVYVEDKFSYAIVRHVWTELLSPADRDALEILPLSGGDTGLLRVAAVEMTKNNSSAFFLFDGDCEPAEGIPDPKCIPEAQDKELDAILEKAFGRSIKPFMLLDSNNPGQRISRNREFLEFARGHFAYLPFRTPEEFVANNHDELARRKGSADPKKRIAEYVEEKLGSTGEVRSAEILIIQRKLFSDISHKLATSAEFEAIKVALIGFLKKFREGE
jgi:predicted ATPase